MCVCVCVCVCINYQTIFKIFISSAVAIQKSHFIMQIQDMDQRSFFLYTIDHKAIQQWADTHHQNSLCDKPFMLKIS